MVNLSPWSIWFGAVVWLGVDGAYNVLPQLVGMALQQISNVNGTYYTVIVLLSCSMSQYWVV